MKKQLAILFPGGEADDFVAGDGWLRGFFKRRGLAMRTATNIMPLSSESRVPQCLKFFTQIQQVCAHKGGMNTEWGRFTPRHRFNADEVGVEFGYILRRTVALKGEKRVWVSHPKHKIEIRECKFTFLPLFCAGAAVTDPQKDWTRQG